MTSLLIDTRVFLWWADASPQLRGDIRESLIDPKNSVHFSIVSAWEIAIKSALGKLKSPASVRAEVERSRFSVLGLDFAHTDALAALPRHHRDPFDRMLVAQARVENLTLVTADRRLEPYDVKVMWA